MKNARTGGRFSASKKREVEKRVPTETVQGCRPDLDAVILSAGFERGVTCLKINLG